MHFKTTNGRLIQATNKYNALKKICPYIYWKGNNPYGLEHVNSKIEVYAFRVRGCDIRRFNDYTIVSETIDGFDHVTQYTPCGRQINQSVTKSKDPIYDLAEGFDFSTLFQ